MSIETPGSEKSEFEYQYPDEHVVEETALEPPEQVVTKRRSLISRIFNKKVIILLVIIVAILVVYKFMTPTLKSAGSTNFSETTPVAAPTVAPPPLAQTTTPVDTGIKQNVDLLSQQTNQEEAQLKDLQAGMQNVSNTVVQLQNSFANLNAAVQILSQQVKQLQLDAQKPKLAAKPVVKKKVVAVKAQTYYLKAVVPGRAWLQATSGKLLTVKVGDPLAGYGVVKAIDANQGWVGTSSGVVIQYGPNDS